MFNITNAHNIFLPQLKNIDVILASSSKYRQKLMQKLNIGFSSISPNIDERLQYNMSMEKNVINIAKNKALSVSKQIAKEDVVIIASDQLAYCDKKILGKPGSYDNALEQLNFISGKELKYYNGLYVIDKKSNRHYNKTNISKIMLSKYSLQEAEYYLKLEESFDCAGSIKTESYGIMLIDKFTINDPNAIIGLPLIDLFKILRTICLTR